jgi:hypothetical protein
MSALPQASSSAMRSDSYISGKVAQLNPVVVPGQGLVLRQRLVY